MCNWVSKGSVIEFGNHRAKNIDRFLAYIKISIFTIGFGLYHESFKIHGIYAFSIFNIITKDRFLRNICITLNQML